MPQPYTDQQAIQDGLLKPSEVGDTSLAELDAGGNTGGPFSPRDRGRQPSNQASPTEVSAEDFFAVGAGKPATKSSFVGEASAEDFFGVKTEKIGSLQGQVIKPGDPGYISQRDTPRVIYKNVGTSKQALEAGTVIVKAGAETVGTMLTGWAAMVPAGYTGLAEKVYQAAGGNISNEQITEHMNKIQETLTYAPRSEAGQITGEAISEGMDKGMSWAEGRASQKAYELAKILGATEQQAQAKANTAGFETLVGLEYLQAVLPFGVVKPGFKFRGRAAPPPPEVDPYNFKSPAKQGPQPDSPPLYVDQQGNVMTVEALKARDELATRMPEAFAPAPEMETSSVRGASLASELDKQFDIKTPEDRKILHSKRGREIRDAFNSDKDYADYLRWYTDNQATMAEITPPEAPVTKTRLPGEPVIVGETLPRPEFQGVAGQLDSYQSGLQKVQQGAGATMSAEEVAALRDLSSAQNRPRIAQAKVEAGRMVDVTPDELNAMRTNPSRSIWTPDTKPILPDTLKKLGLTAGVVAAVAPFASEEQLRDMSLLGAVLTIKPKGGMWHPEAAIRLSNPIAVRAIPRDIATTPAAKPAIDQIRRMAANYLNKHAATATDPLRDVQIPFGDHTEGFGKVVEALTEGETVAARQAYHKRTKGTGLSTEELAQIERAKPEEVVYGFQRSTALDNYLSHVGDYLRQNVKPEDLSKYDLVRAVKETAKWDAELAKKMEKAVVSGEGTVDYKVYPDGMKWVEVGVLPEELPKNIDIRTAKRGSQEIYKLYEDGEALSDYTGSDPTEDFVNVFASKKDAVQEGKKLISARALQAEGNQMGHCVGGYCEAVAAGESKIYSLRDKKGQSHVTIEVQPPNPTDPRGKRATFTTDIVQIKGKQNRAPVAAYLPYVQDFVKSGKWGEVNDLANARLYDTNTIDPAQTARLKGKFPDQRFLTEKEYADALPNSFAGKYESAGLPPGQEGFADPKLLGRLAAIGIGAAAGAALDPENPFEGAVLGSFGVGALTMAHPRQVGAKIKSFFEADKRLRITDLADKHEYAIKAAARSIWQVQNKLIEAVPDPLRRSAISHWIEGDKSIKLTQAELQAAKIATDFFAGMKEIGLSSGVLKDALENYVTHLWKMDDKLRGMLEAKAQASTMSPNTRFAKTRFVPTLQEGMKSVEDGGWGLTPLTEDISEIIGIYGSSVTKAMANRDIIAALKSTKTPEGRGLLEKMDVAPPSYNFINHPQLQGYRVHPDIAPSLRFLFDNKDPNVGVRALEGLNTLSKRMLVSFSMFHAKALVDAYLGASVSGPAGAVKHVPKFLTGDHVLLKQLRSGGAGDLVDTAIKGGLMFSLERALPVVEDVGGSFYKMMKDAQVMADRIIPGTGKAVAGFEKVNHLVDKFMWERLHAGMKLQIFSEKYARLLETNAKAHSRDPKIPLKSEADLAKMAASFTNDMFGGLNWRMLAEEATTKLGRDMAQAAYSPSGRRALQFLMFAPDWTISTTRAALKAFGKGTGVSGLIEPKTLADLHRQYVLRSALYYGLIGTVLNQAFSGKWLWENADPTYIDMGDGRRMQWSKHTMESVHWLMHPRQQALNKLSQVIKIPAEQIMGVQYLSASGHAPRIEEGRRMVSAVKALSPISVQQGFESGEGSGIAGFLGAPIYGKTTEQKAEEKRSKKRDYSGRVEALQRRRERLTEGAR